MTTAWSAADSWDIEDLGGGAMGNTRDPIDHFRTTNQYAGEQFIDVYSWPGVVSIVLGTTSLISCVAAAAYGRHEWIPTAGIVGLLAITGGIVWLVIEHRRVLRIERHWLATRSDDLGSRSSGRHR
ncbi:protein UsfY [Mycolicibacterium elephantis]|uniref:protein UsfY n=1 Tax=Mycolicibacterium elephantis TaxID=81858 RepID=UPI001F23D9E6|nr:protein UsfY [Mycolicibacterium elephantis]